MPLSKIWPKFRWNKKPTQIEDTRMQTLAGDFSQICVTSPAEEDPPFASQKGKENGFQDQKSRAMRYICSPQNTTGDEKSAKLLKAIQQRKISVVYCLLEAYSSQQLDEVSFSGQSLLHYLIWKKDLSVLKAVLDRGAEPNQFNLDGATPLHLAILESWAEGVEELLLHGASADLPPEPTSHTFGVRKEAPLIMALRIGDLPTIFTLLEKSLDLSVRDEHNNTVLHLAACIHCSPILDRLLDNGGQVISDNFAQNDDGDTALHAVFTNTFLSEAEDEIVECIHLLLMHGAEVDAVNSSMRTPLFLACRRGVPRAAEALLSAGADPTIKSVNRRTVLHAACRAGSPETLSLLLKTGIMEDFIHAEDLGGMAPFHLAVNSCSMDCCEILLDNGDHLSEKDSQNESRCSFALRNMPTAKQFFRRIFDKHIHRENEIEDLDFSLNLNFSVLLPKCHDDVDDSIISEICDSKFNSLLKHPLVECFIFYKWGKLRYNFYSYAIIYLIFLILHTFFIVKTYIEENYWVQKQVTLKIVRWLLIILLVSLIIIAGITIFANYSKFLKHLEIYLKAIALYTAAFIVLSHTYKFLSTEVERNIAAISIFFTWIEFMLLLGRLPSLGIYILMFTRVARSLIKFLIAFSSLLVAFALSFSILLNKLPVFKNISVGFVKTLMMMIGEIDYGDIYEEGIKSEEGNLTIVISQIFLILFLFLIPILMANLLIGLAVNDLPDLKKHGKIRGLVKEAAIVVSHERLVFLLKNLFFIPSAPLEFFLKRFRIKRKMTIYPNRCPKKCKRLFSIPSDTLEEAIAISTGDPHTRTIDRSSLQLEDLQIAVLELRNEFREDKKKSEKMLSHILDVLSGGADDADSPSKNIKKIPLKGLWISTRTRDQRENALR